MPRRSILFAAGGSGGHLFPAIAVAEELQRRTSDIRLGIVASEKEIDRTILERYPLESHHLPSVSPNRFLRSPWAVLSENWRAWQAARQLIREQAPAVVIGCGGFASAPLVMAAVRGGIPVVLLEQNLIPGRANVWMSRWATKVCLSFEETLAYLPAAVQRRATGSVSVTGNPIRQSMRLSEPMVSRLPNQLLILGGSQGARHLNEAVGTWLATRPAAMTGWDVMHQTGTTDRSSIASRYASLDGFCTAQAIDFITDPASLYRSATLVIARAGATTLAELASFGAPTILVPLPSAARDHQTANARWYSDRGAARLLTQAETPTGTAQQLAAVVTPLLLDPAQRERLACQISKTARPAAAEAVADIVMEMVS